MRTTTIILVSILCCLLLSNCIAQTKFSVEDAIEYDRRLAKNAKNYIPANGYVPDAQTAIYIATAVALPIYGKKKIDSEAPLHAGLKDGVWTVIGNPPKSLGGELIVQLDKKTGAVLFVSHTQ